MQRQRIISVILTGLSVLVLAVPAQAEHRTASLEDVILLAEGGISDETILVFLDSREIGFELGTEEMLLFREAGVNEEVIRYLLERVAAGSEKVDADTDDLYPPGYYAYPERFYATEYFAGAGYYFGASILPYWWYDDHFLHYQSHGGGYLYGHSGHHGYTSLGHHSSVGQGIHDSSYLARGHAGGGSHLGGGGHTVGHSSPSHGSRTYGSGRHGGTGHSSPGHSSGRNGRHGGGRSGGHGGGHSGGRSGGHGGGHSGGHGGGHSGGHGGGH